MTDTLNTTTHFNWQEELEKTIVNSLVTTFGLDFLLMEDKRGGDVDTILKAREYQKEVREDGSSDIYLSNDTKGKIDSNGRNIDPYKKVQYDNQGNAKRDKKGKVIKKDDYHVESSLYLDRKNKDKIKEQSGELVDSYTGKRINPNDIKKKGGKHVTELDHVISASEIHDDLGRILSGVDGVKLANSDDNLISTHWVINNAKSDHSIDNFFKNGGVRDQKLIDIKDAIAKNKGNLQNSNISTEERIKLQNEINDLSRKKEILENLTEEKMREIEKTAKKSYNEKISWEYYTSSKFFSNTAKAAGKKGLAMGTRQALGLILAEIWFELKEQIPIIYQKCRNKFNIYSFLEEVRAILANIMVRIKERFSDLISAFKDGVIAGFFGNLSTTLLNIFLVSEKMVVKMIKEMWNSIVATIKLLAINPNKLTISELFKECLKILTAGLAVVLGSMINSHLSSLFVFPMGDLLASFLSALSTGIMTIAFMYFIEELWKPCKTKIEAMLDNIKAINAELDRYLLEWAKISFNLNPQEIADFADSLEACNSELERSIVLSQEIQRRNIDLPFESGNIDSGRAWLTSLKC